ncbi:MAG: aromatic ring-hydroxylating dioxygenase subunit alpha [Gammaproteobacteria bacterium]
MRSASPAPGRVRPDFVPGEFYHSPEVARLENARLWPRVWLIACREEEIRASGDFVKFDIAGESILVLRAGAGIKAYYNVCQHRGRRLKDHACGNTGRSLYCRFHGWRWNIDGSIASVLDREDWNGCADFDDAALRLKEVRVDTWAGWVWISMDPDIAPLAQYLDPVPRFLDPFEFEHCRFGWYKTLVMPCNWKLALDAFNEGYHVEATHSQMLKWGTPKSAATAHGLHGQFWYPPAQAEAFGTYGEAGGAQPVDTAPICQGLLAYHEEAMATLKALVSRHSLAALRRLVQECPPRVTYADIIARYRALHREETLAAGARWPEGLTEAAIQAAGVDWHIFPNTIVLPSPDGALWYRARPNGDDPASCIYDVWWLERYAPGAEPELRRDFYPDTASFAGQNPFLEQDFANLASVQQGVRSRGFAGARTNPVQEVAISNFHRGIERFIQRA